MKKIVLKESFGDKSSWRFVNGKIVSDEDGFLTDYTWYKNSEGKHIFMFGDSEIYTPDEDYTDYVTDSEEDAQRWFDSYNGFEPNDNWYDSFNSSDLTFISDPKAQGIVARWYDNEGAYEDFDNLEDYVDFISSDIYNMLDAATNAKEIKIVSKALGISESINKPDVNKDSHIGREVSLCVDCDSEESDECVTLKEGRWEHSISTKNANALRRAVQNDEYADTVEAIKNVYREIHDKYPDLLDDDDLDRYIEDLDGIITDEDDYDFDEDESFEEYIDGSINYELDNLYDFCDNTNIWIPLIEGYCGRKRPYNGKLVETLTKGNKSDFVDAIRNTSDLNRINSLIDEIFWYDKKLGGILKGYIRGMSKDETIADLKAKLTSKLEESAPKKKQAIVSYREKNDKGEYDYKSIVVDYETRLSGDQREFDDVEAVARERGIEIDNLMGIKILKECLKESVVDDIINLSGDAVLKYPVTGVDEFDLLCVKSNGKGRYIIWNENSKTGDKANEVKYSSLDNVLTWLKRGTADEEIFNQLTIRNDRIK